jgi:site-specific DNA-methyltransferase (adenine-specific)
MQTGLFDEIEINGLTIEQVAQTANVSTATIRNWIKTGYLIQIVKGLITKESLDNFMSNIAGKEKLNSRANKLLKDEHDHAELSNSIKLLTQKFNGEEIGIAYENSLSDSYRNREGVYYTPSWIVRDMFVNIEIKSDLKFLDPCCGSGNFIVEAIKAGIAPKNVYGFDVDENAVFITKERIRKEFGFETQNIKVGDFLQETLKLRKEGITFDLIFTNPPWGKKLNKSDKEKYALIYDCGNSIDTTSLFMGASFALLKNKGILGFLIQEAFFNIAAFEYIRNRALTKEILRLIDYGKAFKGLVTKAQAITIKNSSPAEDAQIKCNYGHSAYYRSLKSFRNIPKSIFNFWADEKDSQVIDRLYEIKHASLYGNAKWALGIVTGNNKRFCSDTQIDGYIPVYKGSDITKFGLKDSTTFIQNDFSNFQQVAPLEMYKANEKLIYKFITSDLCFFYDDKQRFILNSANLLIPLDIDITSKQLADLLNSHVINWLFNKLFSTHKILRGDLELLPIHTEYFIEYPVFSEDTYLKYLQITKEENGTYAIKG